MQGFIKLGKKQFLYADVTRNKDQQFKSHILVMQYQIIQFVVRFRSVSIIFLKWNDKYKLVSLPPIKIA